MTPWFSPLSVCGSCWASISSIKRLVLILQASPWFEHSCTTKFYLLISCIMIPRRVASNLRRNVSGTYRIARTAASKVGVISLTCNIIPVRPLSDLIDRAMTDPTTHLQKVTDTILNAVFLVLTCILRTPGRRSEIPSTDRTPWRRRSPSSARYPVDRDFGSFSARADSRKVRNWVRI